MNFKFVETETKGTTRIIYFNSPPANGLNLDVLGELENNLHLLMEEASKIRCLILASRIKDVFIAGADIKMIKRYMSGSDLAGDMIRFNTKIQETINEVESLPFPVIAAINGHAMGGGLETALACDFRFMAKGKARVGLPEIKLGILPGAGGTQRLPRLIGKSKAKDIIYNCKFLDAESALAAGVVDRIYDAESLMEKSLEYAEELKDRAAVSVSVCKMCINQGLEMPLKKGLELEMDGLRRLLKTADMREGVTAFLEKRSPVFKGA